jgi:hypothetical protein
MALGTIKPAFVQTMLTVLTQTPPCVSGSRETRALDGKASDEHAVPPLVVPIVGSGHILGIPWLLCCFCRLGGIGHASVLHLHGRDSSGSYGRNSFSFSRQIADVFQLFVLGKCSRSDGRYHRIGFLVHRDVGFLKNSVGNPFMGFVV